jgi:hypothetical protein
LKSDRLQIFSGGENEDAVWPQARKCPSEAVSRAGNDPQRAAAVGTGLDIDCKHPIHSLHSQN